MCKTQQKPLCNHRWLTTTASSQPPLAHNMHPKCEPNYKLMHCILYCMVCLEPAQQLHCSNQGPIERISGTLCLLACRRQIKFDYIHLSRPLSGLTIHHSAPEEQQQKPQACAGLNLQAPPKTGPPPSTPAVRTFTTDKIPEQPARASSHSKS
jgi:hypothetical protein